MIVVVRKNSILLVVLIFLLSVTLYSLNIGAENVKPVTGSQDVNKTVLLDPGHGGEDPGAVSDYSGLKEKDVNLKIALKVKALLENDSYNVLMTRSEDRLEYNPDTKGITNKRADDLTRRKNMMDTAGEDIVVSIHMNKFPQTQYHGAQVFFPPNSPESQILAMDLQACLKEIADPENTRAALLKKDPIIILQNNKSTIAIVECGFLSNPEEEKRVATDEYQDKLAQAIKAGIDKYFAK